MCTEKTLLVISTLQKELISDNQLGDILDENQKEKRERENKTTRQSVDNNQS